jgi:hypothetical protein
MGRGGGGGGEMISMFSDYVLMNCLYEKFWVFSKWNIPRIFLVIFMTNKNNSKFLTLIKPKLIGICLAKDRGS